MPNSLNIFCLVFEQHKCLRHVACEIYTDHRIFFHLYKCTFQLHVSFHRAIALQKDHLQRIPLFHNLFDCHLSTALHIDLCFSNEKHHVRFFKNLKIRQRKFVHRPKCTHLGHSAHHFRIDRNRYLHFRKHNYLLQLRLPSIRLELWFHHPVLRLRIPPAFH